MKTALFFISALLLSLSSLQAQAFLDDLEDALTLSSPDGRWRADLAFMADTTLFVPEAAPQGTLGFIRDDVFLQPRLSVFLDAKHGDDLLLHAQMNVDRGFDPGAARGGEVRLDEYYLQWRAVDDQLVLRAGRFATAFGAWTTRHLAWDNPFITAPMAYGDVLPLTDQAGPADLAAFSGRRNVADTPATWAPIIWGPSYATGASVAGRLDDFEYAIELKNAALSARPETWDAIQRDEFHTPATLTTRLAWHPAPEWTLGGSFSHGPWMQNTDADQTTYGLDAAYAHGHWQVWAEVVHARFEVPAIGSVQTTGAFIESKYKLTPGMWLAARWNQSWFGDIPGLRNDLSFDRDAWRLDLALGFRLSRHAQFKLQYSTGDKSGHDLEGNHLLAAEVTVRF